MRFADSTIAAVADLLPSRACIHARHSVPGRPFNAIDLLAGLSALRTRCLGWAVGGVVALLFALRILRLLSISTLAAQASNIASDFGVVEEVVSGESLVWPHDADPACGEPDRAGRETEKDMKRPRELAHLSRRTGNEICSFSEMKQSVPRHA